MTAPEAGVETANSGDQAAEYWQLVEQDQLGVQHCLDCGTAQMPPRAHCRRCLSANTRLEPWHGQAIVHSFSILTRAAYPRLEPYVPYCVALVDLGDGLILESWIVDHESGELAVGAPLDLEFRTIAGRKLPVFRLADRVA